MRTAPAHLRRGYARLSLETGWIDAFAAAIRLYDRAGFVPCGPDGDDVDHECSRFFTLDLTRDLAPDVDGR